MSKEKVFSKINGLILVIIGLFFLVLSFFIDENFPQNKDQNIIKKKDNRKLVDLVNSHLQKSYDKEMMDNINIIHQNKVLAPSIKDSVEEIPLNEDEISALYDGNQYEDFIKKELNDKNAIQDKIEGRELETNEEIEKEAVQKKYRQKYAKFFLEKLKKEGYEVQLDEEYRVKAVSKIEVKKDNNLKQYPSQNQKKINVEPYK
jgi:hypothetical protein